MKKFFITYLPASLLLVFLAMTLWTCGGGGGGTVYVPVTNPSSSAFEFGTVKSSAHVVLPQVTIVEEFKPVVKAEEG